MADESGCTASTQAALPSRSGRRVGRRDRLGHHRFTLSTDESEPTQAAPDPGTPGLSTQEQAHILASEAHLSELARVLNTIRLTTTDEQASAEAVLGQKLLRRAVRERELADQAREKAAVQMAPHAAEEPDSSGGGTSAAPVLGAIAAVVTSIAGLVAAWTALRSSRGAKTQPMTS